MPWPPQIDRLLARPGSRAAQALRWGLRGLGASLRAAANDERDDPGWGDLRELVSELDALLGPAGEFAGPAMPAAEPPTRRDDVNPPGSTGAGEPTGPPLTGPLDPRVSEPADEELHPLARVVSACLWCVEHDPPVHHCLQSVFRFGVVTLTGDQRQRYVAELLRRWDRLRSTHQGKDRFKARLDLDEAFHSLVYQPPADAPAWWGRLQAQARDALLQARDRAAQAGCQVHLQLLAGSFADVSRLAPDSIQVDFGVPGEVAACLRAWSRIDGEELKGRVLYRSPEEAP